MISPCITRLTKSHESRYGSPAVSSVDERIFILKYYTYCLECDFCHDECCSHGVDIDVTNVRRIEKHVESLEEYVGVDRTKWFEQEFSVDPEFPGEKFTRTKVVNGACVFHDSRGKGCLLHAFCLEKGLDYHELKPMVSCLFPLTFDDGLLHPSDEAGDGRLICLGDGPTLYRGVRDEVLYYFGEVLVRELDELERAHLPTSQESDAYSLRR